MDRLRPPSLKRTSDSDQPLTTCSGFRASKCRLDHCGRIAHLAFICDDGTVHLITGFAFRGYRSFPSNTTAVLFPLRKLNLIAGQNNTGKSNILRILADAYGEGERSATPWDRPLGDAEHDFARTELHQVDAVLGWEGIADLPAWHDYFRSFLQLPGIALEGYGSGVVNLGVSPSAKVDRDYLRKLADKVGRNDLARTLSREFKNEAGGQPGDDAFRVLCWIADKRPYSPSAHTVGGVRSISNDSEKEPDLNGLSIKRRLLELQNPSTDRLQDKEIFADVQDFVRAVLDDSTITIDIPHDLSTIHVTQGGRTLPIENIGTGVHEVVIIAAAATITRNSILCIEEPEVHLHPILQRKLLRYLESSTTNQYFIATHSAHMLDSELGSIFHVSRADGASSVRFAGNARDRAAVCADLGYRPSDLVQTNAVVWVEGPSDRIYLKHWIERLAPDQFIEGTHYSIMFYGGGLLNSLSPLDAEEVEEFISLRNLNRYMAVVIDSDKKSRNGTINASKKRVIEGLQSDLETSVAWVTDGYTIENYVPEDVLNTAIREAHPTTKNKSFITQDRWSNPLSFDRIGIKKPSKVAISKVATREWNQELPSNLRKKVESVIALIRAANSHT